MLHVIVEVLFPPVGRGYRARISNVLYMLRDDGVGGLRDRERVRGGEGGGGQKGGRAPLESNHFLCLSMRA